MTAITTMTILAPVVNVRFSVEMKEDLTVSLKKYKPLQYKQLNKQRVR